MNHKTPIDIEKARKCAVLLGSPADVVFTEALNELEQAIDAAKYLRTLIPEWATKAPKGLDTTMYGTGSQEGDQKIVDKIKEIDSSVLS